jgi:hypothetical protein
VTSREIRLQENKAFSRLLPILSGYRATRKEIRLQKRFSVGVWMNNIYSLKMFLTKCWKNIVQSLISKNIKVVKVLNASSVPIILFSPSEVNRRRKSGQITHFVSPPKYSFSKIGGKFWQGIKIDIIIIILGLVSNESFILQTD